VLTAEQVDDLSADFIISQLLLLDAEDHTKDIKLFINSPGGSITAGGYSYSHCMNYPDTIS
jgi:ATP-dependent Clp protease protease subunit